MHYIIFVIALACFHIATQSSAACFQQKRVLIKFTAFFISRTKLMNTTAMFLKVYFKQR